MQALVDNGEYEDISDVIVSALHQLLEKSENRDIVEEAVSRYLDSEDCHETIRRIMIAEYRQPNLIGGPPDTPKMVSEPESEYPKKSRGKRLQK